jgi:hypothetical protein
MGPHRRAVDLLGLLNHENHERAYSHEHEHTRRFMSATA